MKPSSAEIVDEIGNWAVLRRFLPSGWEEQARLSGAMKRSRGVSGAEALLRTLLIHLANGCSLAERARRPLAFQSVHQCLWGRDHRFGGIGYRRSQIFLWGLDHNGFHSDYGFHL